MSRTADDWPLLPDIEEPEPPQERRSWGKVSHSDRYRKQRGDLLRAAGRLAGRTGYEGTRVADIVAEAGLSKSTFYEHFATKEECFVELHRRTTGQMLRSAVDTAEGSIARGPFECLVAVIRAFIGYRERNPRLAEVLRAEFGGSSQPEIRSQREENFRRTVHFFVALGRRLGSPLEADDLELSATIVIRGVTDILGDLRREPETFDERLAQIARLGCRAFALPES
jgi:AcrR family transcriptional regulator